MQNIRNPGRVNVPLLIFMSYRVFFFASLRQFCFFSSLFAYLFSRPPTLSTGSCLFFVFRSAKRENGWSSARAAVESPAHQHSFTPTHSHRCAECSEYCTKSLHSIFFFDARELVCFLATRGMPCLCYSDFECA